MARNLSKKARREIKARKRDAAVIIVTTDGTRYNIHSALGAQLLRLWMYDYRDCLSKLQADHCRVLAEPLQYRWGDYTRLY